MRFQDTKFWKNYSKYDCIVKSSSMRSTVDGVILWKLLKENKFSSFLEVGVYQGLTTGLIFETSPGATVIGIDIVDRLNLFHQYYPEFSDQFNFFNQPSQTFDLKDSMFDFILIDGDHRYGPAKEDIFNCLPHLKNTGILAIDDYKTDGVALAIQDLYNLDTDWVPFLRCEQTEYWHHRGQDRGEFIDSLFTDAISNFMLIQNEVDKNNNSICVVKTVGFLTDQTEYFDLALKHYNI